MSPLTIFLAKLLGLYCIVVALAMMARKESALAAVNSVVRNPPLLLLAAVIGLAIGLAMIIGHEIWSGGLLPVVVTLLGWIITIRSAALLAFSPDTIEAFYDTLRYEERFHIYMGGTLILGLYLAIAGLVG
ncbi:MAG TPA: hypothetical protein VET85_12345 [Stellaceae bacterium]|nr:hypothetical protein [Stellaceae bacterium]